jgi:hypothetical protein
LAVLLSDQGRDVGFERSCTETKSDDTEDERTNGIAAGEHSGNGGDDEQDMTQDREGDGDEDGVETAKVFVGNDGTDDGCAVRPERVELSDTERGTLIMALVEDWKMLRWLLTCPIPRAPGWPSSLGSRPVVCGTPSITGRSCWMKFVSSKQLVGWSLYSDERQHTQYLAAIVSKAFAKLDESNGKGSPGNLSRYTRKCLEVLFSGFLALQVGLEDIRVMRLVAES